MAEEEGVVGVAGIAVGGVIVNFTIQRSVSLEVRRDILVKRLSPEVGWS